MVVAMADFRSSIEIRATPDQVFDFLVTPEGMTLWMGEHAVLDPTPGGVFEVDIAGSPIRGRYLEVIRPARVVVSWGVAGSAELPIGASRVSFTLTATDRGTRVDLLHTDLPEPRVAGHADGWGHFLPRLGSIAEGVTPAPDHDWLPLERRGVA
jgi:uncharacterized protein YndB with AHSA1/START domain